MAVVITVTNQKGGVGKTTTASALFAGLALGKKTLAIDLDPQCNFSYCFKSDPNKKSIKELFTDEASFDEVVQKTPFGDFIQSHIALNNIMQELSPYNQMCKLKDIIEGVKDKYDYIIIDTPPAISPLTINALVASDKVIIPVQADTFSLQGAQQLTKNINEIKRMNTNLEIAGILLVRYKARAGLSQYMNDKFQDFSKSLNTKVFNTTIRDSIAIQESQLARQSIFEYDPKSNVSLDYFNFIKEFING